jgi:hypothetical protein
MPAGGRFGENLASWIDGRQKQQQQFSTVVRAQGSNDTYPETPQVRTPRQPSNFQKYQPTTQDYQPDRIAEGLKGMGDVSPTEIFNIFTRKAEKINQAAITARKRIKEQEEKMLPEEMAAKIDQNKYDIETQRYALEGHKTTIANALHVFNGKDWEDLRQVGERFMQAIQEHDSYNANAAGYNFVMGVFATQPAYLSIIEIYEDVIDKAVENYDLALELLADSMAQLTKAQKEIDPKRVVNQQAAKIKRLEFELLKAKAGYEPEDEDEEEPENELPEDEAASAVPSEEDKNIGKPVKPEGRTYGRQPKGGKTSG